MTRGVRFYHALYDAALRLLPRWFRERAAEELRVVFDARMTEARSRTVRACVLIHELAGLLRVAVVLRLPQAAGGAAGWNATEARRSGMLDSLRQDLKFAMRTLRRRPAVALLATATLALGVGASTAMFSVVDAVLLRPLPFERPEQIVQVWPTIEDWKDHPIMHVAWQHGAFSPPELAQWLNAQRSFETAAGWRVQPGRVPARAGAKRVSVGHATAGLFPLLGVEPHLGRLPAADDTEAVIALSHAYWRSHHGGDTQLIGREILIDEQPVRVIGVLPPEFELVGVSADMWRPMHIDVADPRRDLHFLKAIGRLRTGVSMAQAQAETAMLLGGMSAAHPGHLTHRARLNSPVREATQNVRGPLLIFASASLLLLMTACANVALLLLGAGASRVRELAVRGALGARKSRIALQLFMESVVVCGLGALAALAVAFGLLHVLVFVAPEGIPRIEQVAVDLRTFVVTALLAIVTGVLVGSFPAFSLTRVEAADALRAGATAPGRGRLQQGIVIVELALATVLLVGAGLLTRTMSELHRIDPGFNAEGLVTIELELPWYRFYRPDIPVGAARLLARAGREDPAAQLQALSQRLIDAVSSIPGVEEVAVSSHMPYSDGRSTSAVEPEGHVRAPGEQIVAARRYVSGNFFEVMRIPALHGRVLTPADEHPNAERVMVVNEKFVRHVWPDGRWLDRKVGFHGEEYRVVGVIAETREDDVRGDEDAFKFYVANRGEALAQGNLMVRPSMSFPALAPVMRERIWETDPNVVIRGVRLMSERIDASLANYRYRMRLMLAFSCLAVLFSLLGIYSVVSRSVARRQQELGVRIALGAARRRILSLVLREGVFLGIAGGALGVAAAFIAARLIESLLWGVPPTDAVTFGVIAGSLLLLSLVATALPATRAAAIEPMAALRS